MDFKNFHSFETALYKLAERPFASKKDAVLMSPATYLSDTTRANANVVETLKEHGTLVHHHALEHSYPHCWRHKTPLIFRATPQWFISMDNKGLRQDSLNEIEKTQWIPD